VGRKQVSWRQGETVNGATNFTKICKEFDTVDAISQFFRWSSKIKSFNKTVLKNGEENGKRI
jgi:hypothetical protein